MLINLILVVILHCIHISKYQLAHIKYVISSCQLYLKKAGKEPYICGLRE